MKGTERMYNKHPRWSVQYNARDLSGVWKTEKQFVCPVEAFDFATLATGTLRNGGLVYRVWDRKRDCEVLWPNEWYATTPAPAGSTSSDLFRLSAWADEVSARFVNRVEGL